MEPWGGAIGPFLQKVNAKADAINGRMLATVQFAEQAAAKRGSVCHCRPISIDTSSPA